MRSFIFDVDGTLTPSRQKIDNAFSAFFISFCQSHDVYLVTGSDKDKTVEQIGEDVYNSCKKVYQCSGNEVWIKDKCVEKTNWSLHPAALLWCNNELVKSHFPLRTGRHIEHRTGMVNFSIVGRNATLGERHLYVKWDTQNNERKSITNRFNERFPDLEATIGGDTGIDISKRGMNKSQILKDFTDSKLYFFGDATYPGGNDHIIAEKIKQLGGMVYDVKGWNDTWNILQELE